MTHITIEKEKLESVLEALESGVKTTADRISWTEYDCELMEQAITTIKEALAQPKEPEQKPVAWRFQSPVGGWAYGKEPPIGSKYAVEPLYATPPQRKPLTDEQIGEIGRKYEKFDNHGNEFFARWGFARAIEAAHNIKE